MANTLTQQKILKLLKKELPYLEKTFSVKSIGVFGSYVRGDQNKKSDLDILVELYKPIGLKFFELKNYLEDILKIQVDLTTKKALKPTLKDNILNEAIML